MPVKQIALSERKSQAMPLKRAWPEKSSDKHHTRQRKKLWDLQARFHCSVIGTCLTLNELRRLCRKANIIFETPVSDHELHSAFVNVAGESAYPSRLLQKHLDSKYKRIIRQLLRIRSAGELQLLWVEVMKTGEVASAFWALVTHPCTSDELLDQMYGDIHMLSHLAGATVRVDMQELNRLRQLTRTLARQLAEMQAKAKTQIKGRDNTIRRLNNRLKQSEVAARELEVAREQLAALENDPLSRQLRKQAEEISLKLTAEQARAERAETSAETWKQMAVENGDRHLRLEGHLAEVHAERDALEATLAKLLTPDCSSCSTQEGCLGNINLCGRCILYVGGRSRQCAHFRALVERQNGQFIHHDGGLHGGRLRLGSILPQADVVLCPLDCVSHDAANRVKQFCKRHGKRLVLLPRSSLAAFTRGLNELAA